MLAKRMRVAKATSPSTSAWRCRMSAQVMVQEVSIGERFLYFLHATVNLPGEGANVS